MAVRYDTGELQKPVRQPNGWLRADGFITRVGVFKYRKADGSEFREYRPAEEVFKQDSLESFGVVPLTNGHPEVGLLDDSNTKDFQVGTVVAPRADGKLVRAQVLVTDAKTIKEMESGKTQLSCGYLCDLEEAPGVSPDGEHYDAIQKNIRGNHVALVEIGRAGPSVRLRVDEASIVVEDSNTDPIRKESATEISMLKFKIDGVDHEMSDTAAQAMQKALTERETQVATAKADAVKLQKDLDLEKARADKADAELVKARAELKEAPAKALAAMKARADIESKARGVLGEEEKFDGMSDEEVKKAVIACDMPKLKLDGKSSDYVDALFDRIVTDSEESEDEGSEEVIERSDASDVLAAAQRKYAEALAKVSPK